MSLTASLQKINNPIQLSTPYNISITWWALHIKSKSFIYKNFYNISGPNSLLIPLSLFSFHPFLSYTGSDHSKSHKRPVGGIYVGRWSDYIFFIFVNSGDNPPCIHNILSSINAQIGKQLKQSIKYFQIFILYRRLHSS